MSRTSVRFTRRTFLAGTAATAGLTAGGGLSAILAARQAPALATSDKMRPQVPFGVQTGDIMPDGGLLWSATDRPARMLIECATRSDFSDVRRIQGPDVLAATGYTGKFDLRGLPAGQDIFYRVRFQDLGDLKTLSAPVEGRFRTAPSALTDVSFVWGGDVNGQGWGINEDWGGMKIFDAMLADRPDFFIHSGDSIYADGPIQAEKEMPQGGVWKSLTIEEKSKVAETLDEFRGNYRYNLMDRPYRSFLAETPMLAQWDDHETVNN